MNKSFEQKSTKIRIANFVFKIVIEENDLLKDFKSRYSDFLTRKKELKTIEVYFNNKPRRKFLCSKEDLKKKKIKIYLNYKSAKDKISSESSTPVFDYFLLELIYNILLSKKIFVFHASGVVYNKKAYLFLGPSGSGKTTIALLSKNKIINDNEILIKFENNKFFAYSSPIQRKKVKPMNSKAEIKSIFILKGKGNNIIRKLDKKKALKEIIKNLYYTYETNKLETKDLKNLMILIDNLLEKVNCYELSFKIGDQIWKKIINC
jgi:hypothetical protein